MTSWATASGSSLVPATGEVAVAIVRSPDALVRSCLLAGPCR
ncbi:hypothetical protein AB0B45_40610 [Nonomuraea sp. NPDC049152]